MKIRFYAFSALIGVWSTLSYAQPVRPQTPVEPFPYHIKEVMLHNINDGIKIGATLTVPDTTAKHAAVILINGSGPQDRNSGLLGHQPFWVLSDYLSRNGIAVLRMDDRGVGKTEGDYNTSSLTQFNQDVLVALDFLKKLKYIDPKHIGLLGHSLGGSTAIQLSASQTDVNFTILLAAAGLQGSELMLLQKKKIEEKMGLPSPMIEKGQENIGGAYQLLLSYEIKSDSLKPKLSQYFKTVFGPSLPSNQLEMLVSQLTSPWLVEFIRYNPATDLAKIKNPVLAMNGSNDLQVPAKENLSTLEKLLRQSGNQKVTIHELDGLNHLFQHSTTGLPNDYATIEETFAPEAMTIIKEWIIEQVKK